MTLIAARNMPAALSALGAFQRHTHLFCQRQNTGLTGLDDHYSPVS